MCNHVDCPRRSLDTGDTVTPLVFKDKRQNNLYNFVLK